MDLENLTKHQIILLTLLVSFITSMATGIVTVSLMQQAPQSVTRTINQIVEHTVQTVVPSNNQSASVSTQKTIVIKDDDLVSQTIATVQKSIIRIVVHGSDDLLARGVIVGPTVALTDKAALEDSGATDFDAILPNGAKVPITLQNVGTTTPFALVTLAASTTSTPYTPLPIADISKIHLGQSVLRISGQSVDSVGVGVVAMLPASSGLVQASVESSTPGSALVTQFGELIGITTGVSLAQSSASYSIGILPQTTQNPEPKPVSKSY